MKRKEANQTANSILKKLSNYTWIEKKIEDLELAPGYVAVIEELERKSDSGIYIPPAGNAKIGKIVKLGNQREDVKVGDRIIYEEWQGGKWNFVNPERIDEEVKCLIMGSEYILAKLEEGN